MAFPNSHHEKEHSRIILLLFLLPARAYVHNHPPLYGQTKKHENTCFLQINDKYLDGHRDAEYLLVPQAFQIQLSQREMKLNDHHLKLMDAEVPAKAKVRTEHHLL